MDLAFLRPVYERGEPCAYVCLDASRSAEDGAAMVGLRWRHLREELAGSGADRPTLDAIEELLNTPDRAAPGRVVLAAEGEILHTEALPHPPAEAAAAWSALPDPFPYLMGRPEPVAHLRVLVDRTGADIAAVTGDQVERTVQGRGWPVHKVRAGGRAEQRYQRGALDTWRENAVEIAHEIRKLEEGAHAEIIVLAGDVRERELVLDHLDDSVRARTFVAAHGTRAPGGDPARWEEDVLGIIAEHVARRSRADVERFNEGHRTSGLAATASAFGVGQVETLIVSEPPRGTLWCGPQGRQVAASEAEIRALGVTAPMRVPAGAALARAAATTGAALRVVAPQDLDLPDGVGALLRFEL